MYDQQRGTDVMCAKPNLHYGQFQATHTTENESEPSGCLVSGVHRLREVDGLIHHTLPLCLRARYFVHFVGMTYA